MKQRWHWGTGIALVYIVFAAGTVGFAVFAMSQDVDLVSPEYYADAMSYDSRQAAAERALGLPLSASLTSNVRGGPTTLTVAFPPDVRPASGTIALYRASNSRADRLIEIDPNNLDADGRLRASLNTLVAGQWIVQISWKSGGRDYYVERRVVAP